MEKSTNKVRLLHLSSVQLIVLSYVIVMFVSAILLMMPFSLKEGVKISFIDALFVAVSAVSVTGLSTVSISETFTVPGILILAMQLQIGGIGIMTMSTLIWLLAGKKIGLKERQLIMTDQNRLSLSGMVTLMKEILLLILWIEFFGMIFLWVRYLFYFNNGIEALYHAFFASISATTNAGFDITGHSLIPFIDDYYVQFVTMILIIFGAIGFPVLIEVKDYLKSGRKLPVYHFSLFTKLTTSVFFILLVLGTILFYLFERRHLYSDLSWHKAWMISLFQSVTSRSAGLVTIDISQLTEASQLWMSVLMFIGASPSSVGGGIRTTTFAIIVLTIFMFARGRTTIQIFRREILLEDIIRAFVVASVGGIITVVSIIALIIIENQPLTAIIFEVSSAFGTNGASTGITSELTTASKIILMLLMFIGRIGILSLLFLIRGKTKKDIYHLPKERVIIG
ncbi:MAG TPA: TrkH family potassium uptake protein [Massilibacterium sp.]|nr:TrkH family potassium uptake protein [Massilibacterium sp.]